MEWSGCARAKQIMAKARSEMDRGDRFVIEGIPHRNTVPTYLRSFTAYII